MRSNMYLVFLSVFTLVLPACSESNFAGNANKPKTADAGKKGGGSDQTDTDQEGTGGKDADIIGGKPIVVDDSANADEVGTVNSSNSGKPNIIDGEDGSIIVPGVKVQRVGVNFEDKGLSGDRDYNDAVLCFTGGFGVEGTNVVSDKTQTVVASTSSISGCHHTMRVDIVHADGSKEPPQTFDSRNATPINMSFKRGSKLEVAMTWSDKCGSNERNMHSDADCRVLPDVCNTTGH